jgi:hypothetical protein
MTIYCYDTEFLEDGNTIELISIGIVCEDGREYYAVNSDMDWKRVVDNGWLQENVLPHLPCAGEKRNGIVYRVLDRTNAAVKPKWVIANEVREFLLDGYKDLGNGCAIGHEPELWAYYAAYDHVALAQLWGPMVDLPKGIPMYTHDLMQEMDRLGIDSDVVPHADDEHDALADARWNRLVLSEIRRAAGAS